MVWDAVAPLPAWPSSPRAASPPPPPLFPVVFYKKLALGLEFKEEALFVQDILSGKGYACAGVHLPDRVIALA